MSNISYASPAFSLSRGRLFAFATAISVANTVTGDIVAALQKYRPLEALTQGLGVNWAVWLAAIVAIHLALRADGERAANRLDIVAAVSCVGLSLVPVWSFAAIGGTLLAGRVVLAGERDPRLRSAAIVLLAVMINLLWAKGLIMVAAKPLEFVDAQAVGLLTGTQVQGNVVPFLEGRGGYLLMSRCTSVENMSLALLMWIAITRGFQPDPAPRVWLIAAAVAATVVGINLIRLSLLAQNSAMFHAIHGPTGQEILSFLITLTGAAWAVWTVRREIFR